MNWALVIHTMAPEHLLLLGIVVTVLPDNGFKYVSDRFWKG